MPPPPTPNTSNPNLLNQMQNTSPGAPSFPAPTPPRAPTITPAQRSLQSRAKPFGDPSAAEPFEDMRRREQADAILASTEMLIWYNAARNESMSQTRRHFENIVLGIEDEEVLWRDEWEVPPEQRARREGPEGLGGGGSPARSAKGKERAKKRG